MCEDELLILIIEEFVNPLGRKLAKKIAERQLGYELDESAKEFPREHEIQCCLGEMVFKAFRNLSESKSPCGSECTQKE